MSTNPPDPGLGNPVLRKAFTIIAVIHAVLLVVQPLLAGMSLEGSMIALDMHYYNGMAIMTVAMLLIVAAVLWWKPGGGPAAAIGPAAGMLILEIVQFVIGDSGVFSVHLMLGIALLAGSFMMVRLGMRGPRRPRTAVEADAS